MIPILPLDVSDPGDTFARQIFEKMIESDKADLERMESLGLLHTVSYLAVAFLYELRKHDHAPPVGGEYEKSLLNILLSLAYAIRKESTREPS